MAKFTVKITETLVKEIAVIASNPDMAVGIVARMYRDEDVVLDYADFDEVNFEIIITE
jgi:hypothetical protein